MFLAAEVAISSGIEFSFFKDCEKIVIFDGVFVQKNVERICKSFVMHYNITQAHIDNFTCRLLKLYFVYIKNDLWWSNYNLICGGEQQSSITTITCKEKDAKSVVKFVIITKTKMSPSAPTVFLRK